MNTTLSAVLRRESRAAFTLVELLVVVSLLALMTSMLLPALARTQPNSKAIQCQNNLRQLTAAWMIYSSDFNGRLPINQHGSDVRGGIDPTCWSQGWLDWDTGNTDNTNSHFLINERYATMAPYCGRDPRLFKCPADTYLSPGQTARGWPARVRSVSMNGAVGDGGTKDSMISGYFYAKKVTDLVNPTPAKAWVFVDEHPDSINDPCFLFDVSLPPSAYSWLDLPASYHDGGCSFAFADGHSEIKKWADPSTQRPVRLMDLVSFACPNGADYAWMAERTPKRP